MKFQLKSNDATIIKNIFGAFLVKGISLIISVLLLPAYIKFFNNQTILGIWYTVLSILNWVVLFDLGLGNGLRNMLPKALEANDRVQIRKQISTTYMLMTGIAICVTVIGCFFIPIVNWNYIFNVSSDVVNNRILVKTVEIVFIGIMLQIVLKIITSILYALQKSAIVNAMSLCTNILILIALLVLPSKSLEENLTTMSIINVVAANLPYVVCTVIIFSTILKDCKPSIRIFEKQYVKTIFNIGISLLWLQLVYMVISSANEIMISNFTSPDNVVLYQAYYKIFKTGGMIVSLALTPIWSAVTKAQAQRNYRWIKKVYLGFLCASLLCLVLELCIVPVLQVVMDVWLGTDSIIVNSGYAIIFAFSSSMMVLHYVNTSIGNGLSYFKLQLIWMTFAAIICVPLCYVLVQLTGTWIGVVLGASISTVPYEFFAPFFTLKILNRKIAEN